MVAGPSKLIMILMLMVSRGGGNEILDYLDTNDYWQAKQVKVSVETMLVEIGPAGEAVDVDELIKQLGDDAFEVREAAQRKLIAAGAKALPKVREATKSEDLEVATRAQKIIGQLTSGGDPAAVRRLMAIRTLGELKDARSVPRLKGLLKSAKPFEADYAKRALAALSGKPVDVAKPDPKALAQDVGLLPKGCGMVLHARMTGGKPVCMDEVLKTLPDKMEGLDKASMRKEVTAMLVMFVETTGNVRLDSVTFGLSSEVGSREGWMTIIARGQYDRDAVLRALKDVSGNDFRMEKIDGQEVVRLVDGEVNLILDEGERLVMVGGPQPQDDAGVLKIPLREVIGALKTGKGEIARDGEMGKLVAGMDPANEVNLVVRLNDTYREVPFLRPFDTLQASVRAGTRGSEWKLVAKGQNAEAIKAMAVQFEATRKQALADIRRAPKHVVVMMEPYLKLMEGVKVEQDKTTVTLSATLEGRESAPGLFLMGFFLVADHGF